DDPYSPCCFVEQEVCIGCCSCQAPATASGKLTSVDVRFSLGRAELGKPAGDIVLHLDDPADGLTATPRSLRFSSLTDGAAAAYGEDGSLLSVEAPEVRAVITKKDDYGYSISMYKKDDSPVADWQVRNPGGNAAVLEITETRGAETKTYTYEHSGEAAAGTWKLIRSGTGSEGKTSVITETRKETLEWADTRTVIRTVEEAGGSSYRTKSVYNVFPPIISSTEDESGYTAE
ncbi:MAG: hypothetical protein GY754_35480, partial [bacterium]|nr:hypothetical protein [bacterium]